MIIKMRKMLLCFLVVQILVITLAAISYAATCSNRWSASSSQTMETEIMSATETLYANGERYLSIKRGWKTTHIYFLLGVLLVKGLDDDEINFDTIFWLPMVFLQGGIPDKAFPQGPCSITKKTPISLTEAEGEVVPESQGVIAYDYTLKGKQNVKHFKGVMKFTPPEAAPSDDIIVKDFKIVNRTKPYTVVGSKDMPVTTLGELRRALIEKKKRSEKWTGPIPEIIMAPEEKEDAGARIEIYPFSFEPTHVFVDKKGRVVVETPCILISDFYDDIAMCTNKLFKEGYINREGKVIVEPKYSTQDHDRFSEGLASVKENGKWGYIDKTGALVIKPQFEISYSFHEGLAATRMDKKWGFIDKTGKFVIEPKFNNVGHFHDDLSSAYIQGKNGWTYGFINRKGDWVIEPQFYPEPRGFSSGLSAINKNGKWGFIDKAGKIVIEPQFERVESFIEESAVVQKNGKFFLIDKLGNCISGEYQRMTSTKDNMIMIGDNDKFGFIDRTGHVIIKPQFDDLRYHGQFSEGLAAVKKDGKVGYINKTGQFIIEPQFDGAGEFKNGVATGRKNEKTFLIDKSGQIFVYRDKVCDRNVIKNGKGEMTWPRNIKELCGQKNE